jgi:peptidyl-tRNA hydrolase
MLANIDYFSAHSSVAQIATEHETPILDWFEKQQPLFDEWLTSGHYTKLVMQADNESILSNVKEYLETRGYRTYLVIDEGRTEIDPFTKTALAVELVDKDDERVQQHFGEFRTYKPPKPDLKKRRTGGWKKR